jgi:hypothetical protein
MGKVAKSLLNVRFEKDVPFRNSCWHVKEPSLLKEILHASLNLWYVILNSAVIMQLFISVKC